MKIDGEQIPALLLTAFSISIWEESPKILFPRKLESEDLKVTEDTIRVRISVLMD